MNISNKPSPSRNRQSKQAHKSSSPANSQKSKSSNQVLLDEIHNEILSFSRMYEIIPKTNDIIIKLQDQISQILSSIEINISSTDHDGNCIKNFLKSWSIFTSFFEDLDNNNDDFQRSIHFYLQQLRKAENSMHIAEQSINVSDTSTKAQFSNLYNSFNNLFSTFQEASSTGHIRYAYKLFNLFFDSTN